MIFLFLPVHVKGMKLVLNAIDNGFAPGTFLHVWESGDADI